MHVGQLIFATFYDKNGKTSYDSLLPKFLSPTYLTIHLM